MLIHQLRVVGTNRDGSIRYECIACHQTDLNIPCKPQPIKRAVKAAGKRARKPNKTAKRKLLRKLEKSAKAARARVSKRRAKKQR